MRSEKNDMLELTADIIEEQHRRVEESPNYGKEGLIIRDVLREYRLNKDINTVAMKIAVIDVTNSTHLAQYKSILSLYDLAEFICKIPNFDERVKNGDPELVNIIAKNISDKDRKTINLFSFASKYCTYHNEGIYRRDDYSIFDGVVRDTLPDYLQKSSRDNLRGITSHKLDIWRQNYNYQAFNDCIGELLDEYNIKLDFRRRKFDHFLWYANRKGAKSEE